MALTNFKFKPLNFIEPNKPPEFFHVRVCSVRNFAKNASSLYDNHPCCSGVFRCRPIIHRKCSKYSVWRRACNENSQAEIFTPKKVSSSAAEVSPSSSEDSYVPLFVRMLGLDNDPQDREQAVVALWKYSLGGKKCVDNIMKYQGILNLIVNLLKSDTESACEASSGLLRVISSINVYRNLVAESGAIEEITGMLTRSSLSSNVKEQSICTLWNLSVDEKLGERIGSYEILPLLIKFLDDEDLRVNEAAAGVLANLALSPLNHKILVEYHVIPKLAKLLKADEEDSKVIRKMAKNALLELAKDEYNRILLIEEGLVMVPLVGASAYKSFKPSLYSWPTLPDGTKIQQNPKVPSRYGASELLLGLNIENDKSDVDLESAKINAVVGRTQQQFLARIGAIEIEDGNNNSDGTLKYTLLPWVDAVARLVLIIGLEDELAIARAAESIADASINEHMRISFKEAGAVKLLVRLIHHTNDDVRVGVVRALDRLSISNYVCETIEEEGALDHLVNLLKEQPKAGISHSFTSMLLNILSRILDPNKEIKSKFYEEPTNGSRNGLESATVGNEMITSDQNPSMQKNKAASTLVDLTFLSCLVDALKTSSDPDMQRKAASILEFVVMIEPSIENLVSAGIGNGLESVLQQKSLIGDVGIDESVERPELQIAQLEEAGLAVSSASRLLTKLLDFDQFYQSINSLHFTKLLRKILASPIPLHCKDWVAASLIKLNSMSGHNLYDFENPINMEVMLYETIPRLVHQIKNSYDPEVQEAAVLELNRIVSEGMVSDPAQGLASEDVISNLVRLMENGTQRAQEASLAILYSLSMDSENHGVILASGAVSVLRKYVLAQKAQWIRALRLLRTLPT